MAEHIQRRNIVVGAITIAALAASFILALRVRDRVDVPLVIVAPAGTAVTVDGEDPRVLPSQPNTPNTLASYYFLTNAGEHEVRFQAPGRARREQSITIRETRVPVIFTLLRDTLREMRNRTE
jgi:hypothetical protein